MDVRIVDAEAIRLAQGDVLIVKLNMGDPEACEEIARALGRLGLTTSVEVHHVEAILGRHGESGCHHHVDGLLTLHAVCHELEHHGSRSRYAPRPEQLGLDVA